MVDVNAGMSGEATPRYLAMLESDRADWWQSKNFDKWKSHYISEYPRGRFIVERLGRYVSDFRVEGARVLDVGCGDAGVPIAFAEAGAEAVGIEPFERSVERGRVRAEEHGVAVELLHSFAESLPFPDASFDLVILDNVLEHVEDRDRTLAEIRRVVRPGGLLYLVTPKPFALYSLWSDPHYAMAGLVLLPRPLQVWYFERVRGGGAGNYGVGLIPTRRWVLRRLRRYGFTLLASPREIWVDYVRSKIGRPEEISTGLKRRIAAWVERHPGATGGRLTSRVWDIGMGSNFFIARRD
jgi:2-polyprenyl-3-methyl-5-hydroxy-6-metoxy-1,4-benzoquinol methylase